MATEVIVTLHVTAPPLLQNVTVNGHFNRSGLHVDSRPNITLFGCRVQSDGTPQPSDSNRSSVSHKPNTLEPGVFSAGSPASSEGPNSNTDHTHQPNRSHCLFHLKDVRRTSSKTGEAPDNLVSSSHVLDLLVYGNVLLAPPAVLEHSRYISTDTKP